MSTYLRSFEIFRKISSKYLLQNLHTYNLSKYFEKLIYIPISKSTYLRSFEIFRKINLHIYFKTYIFTIFRNLSKINLYTTTCAQPTYLYSRFFEIRFIYSTTKFFFEMQFYVAKIEFQGRNYF